VIELIKTPPPDVPGGHQARFLPSASHHTTKRDGTHLSACATSTVPPRERKTSHHLEAVRAGPRSSALPLMAGARCQPLARSAVERERRPALTQTGPPTHLPRAAHPLNSPHGTDDAVPRVLPSAPPYGDLARNLVSRPSSGEGEALPDESAGRGIRLRPGRALWMRPLFSHRRESLKRCRHQSAPAPCRTSD
jgi:hypothetical protein